MNELVKTSEDELVMVVPNLRSVLLSVRVVLMR